MLASALKCQLAYKEQFLMASLLLVLLTQQCSAGWGEGVLRVSTLHIDLCNLHIMLSVSGATVLVSAKYRLTYMCTVTASAAATATIHGLHTAEHIITGGDLHRLHIMRCNLSFRMYKTCQAG